MEWDSKMSSWDFTEELQQNVEHNMGIVGSSSEIDCSVDLKLGGLGEFGLVDKWRQQSSMPSSSSSPSKRARQPSNAGQVAMCSVDGCRANLSNCREYHRRHKVCEAHSKTPVVMVGGLEQRFCQQCSRFHLLVEFDEVKRSCRKRLDGHNRRRRKPQPGPINPAVLFPNNQGSGFLTYPHMLPTSLPEPHWVGVIKPEEDSPYTPQPHLHAFNAPPHFSGSFPQEKQFPFLHDAQIAFTRTAMEATTSACQPLLETITMTESRGKYFPDGLTQVLDSDCALSLLSSQSPTSSINMSQIFPAERIPMGQPHVSALGYNSLGQFSSSQALGKVMSTGFSCSKGEDEQDGGVLVTDAGANMHCHSVFDAGGKGSSDSGSHALPFSWQ